MFPSLARVSLGALIALQSVQSAMAWNWWVVDEPCCCEFDWDCCESCVVIEDDSCCEVEPMIVDACGCGNEPAVPEATEAARQPEPASSQQPDTPSTETPQPALDPSEELPPAPINVPTTPAGEPAGNELFPGPAAEAATPGATAPDAVAPASEPETQPSDNAGGLFDEPAAETENYPAPSAQPSTDADAPATESESAGGSSFEDVFGEPSATPQDAADDTSGVEEQATEIESIETESAEDETLEQPAADPLDDLFGPSSAVERPGSQRELAVRLPVPQRLAGEEYRAWSDRNGAPQCRGRLMRVTTEGVFIVQPSGELLAVGFSQLSDQDLSFVRGQVQTQRAQLAIEEANSQLAARNAR